MGRGEAEERRGGGEKEWGEKEQEREREGRREGGRRRKVEGEEL